MEEQTKQQLKQAVLHIIDHSTKDWFYRLKYCGSFEPGEFSYEHETDEELLVAEAFHNKELEIVQIEDRYDGDGSEYNYTIQFPQLDDILVTLNGYYSSWDSPDFGEVFLSKPYEYKETRYGRLY